MFNYKRIVSRYLREAADKIDAGTSEITEDEAMDILSNIAHQPMSKAQAYKYLNLSRARFDMLVTLGKIPKGRKRVGFKEKVWWKDELDKCKYREKK